MNKQVVEVLAGGATLEKAAKEPGYSKSEVHRIASDSVFPAGKTERPPKVKGTDGKMYPRKDKPRQPKTAPPVKEDEDDELGEETVDAVQPTAQGVGGIPHRRRRLRPT